MLIICNIQKLFILSKDYMPPDIIIYVYATLFCLDFMRHHILVYIILSPELKTNIIYKIPIVFIHDPSAQTPLGLVTRRKNPSHIIRVYNVVFSTYNTCVLYII